jgi:hypothetical protein
MQSCLHSLTVTRISKISDRMGHTAPTDALHLCFILLSLSRFDALPRAPLELAENDCCDDFPRRTNSKTMI